MFAILITDLITTIINNKCASFAFFSLSYKMVNRQWEQVVDRRHMYTQIYI